MKNSAYNDSLALVNQRLTQYESLYLIGLKSTRNIYPTLDSLSVNKDSLGVNIAKQFLYISSIIRF